MDEKEERLYDLYALDEDIKICECLTIRTKEQLLSEVEIQALEHLIEAYRKVKEENKRLEFELEIKKYCKVNELTEDLIYYKNLAREYQGNCIPKSKIKEKIEELLEKGKQMSEKERQEETQFMQGKLKTLEELLEEE